MGMHLDVYIIYVKKGVRETLTGWTSNSPRRNHPGKNNVAEFSKIENEFAMGFSGDFWGFLSKLKTEI